MKKKLRKIQLAVETTGAQLVARIVGPQAIGQETFESEIAALFRAWGLLVQGFTVRMREVNDTWELRWERRP